MQFTKDEYGKEILVKDGDLQVMMEWERPYMEACIAALKPTGRVLEVGFGLGYSADAIQSYKPKSHSIIECDPIVLKRAEAWADGKKGVKLVEGTWQDRLADLGKFDQVFFDDYTPYSEEEVDAVQQTIDAQKQAADKADDMHKQLRVELDRFKGVTFSDADLQDFLGYLQEHQDVDSQQVQRFVDQLVEQGNITAGQKARFLREYTVDSALAAADAALEEAPSERERLAQFQAQPLRQGDRLLGFFEICLESHMEKGARITAYFDYAQYKARQDSVAAWIEGRGDVRVVAEEVMDIDVPPNCRYYAADKALVLVLEKTE